jgi:hypothetical protein
MLLSQRTQPEQRLSATFSIWDQVPPDQVRARPRASEAQVHAPGQTKPPAPLAAPGDTGRESIRDLGRE